MRTPQNFAKSPTFACMYCRHAKNGRSDSTSSILTLYGGHDSVLWGAHKLSEEHIGATGHPHYYLNTKVRTLGKLKYGRFFFAGMLIFDRKLKNRQEEQLFTKVQLKAIQYIQLELTSDKIPAHFFHYQKYGEISSHTG